MDRRRPVSFQSLFVRFGRIPFVLGEAVHRPLFVIGGHDAVAFHLGENRSRHDFGNQVIALDDRFRFTGEDRRTIAVDQGFGIGRVFCN